MDYFKEGNTIEEVINKMKEKKFKMDKIIDELNSFLISLERKGFYENAPIKEEVRNEPFLQLYVTNKCNLRCIHCYMDAGKSKNNELISLEWLKVIDEFSKLYKTKVTFTGGEPLILSDIFVLTKSAKEKGLSVEIFSNGTFINNEKIVKKLTESVDIIQLSLDGATAPVNDRIRGKGVFNKVLKAIQLLKDTNIKLRLATTVMPQNINDLKENIEHLVKSFDTDKIEMKFGFATTTGRADDSFRFANYSVAEKEMQEILKILYKKRLKAMRKFEPNLIVRNCGFGMNITISSTGDIFPCAIPMYKVGNVRKDKLKKVIEKISNDRIASNVENLKECSQCDLKYFCYGGCRLNNTTYNRSLFKPVCDSKKKEDLYLMLINRFFKTIFDKDFFFI